MKSWWLWKWWNNTIKYHSQQHKIDWLQLEPLIPFSEILIYSVRTWFLEPKLTKQALVYLITGMLEARGGEGYSREFWIGGCREGSWTLILFKD